MIKQNLNIKLKSFRTADKQQIENKFLAKDKEFQLLDSVTPKVAGKLGCFHKATLRNEQVICRVVELERITNYVLEDWWNEMGKYEAVRGLKGTYLVGTLGYNLGIRGDKTMLHIFSPVLTSLYDTLHKPIQSHSPALDKLQLSLSLARVLYTLHSFQPPLAHGHITSHNLFVSGSQLLLSDLDLLPLLKYANTFYDYRNFCSVWSPPEVLKSPKKMDEPTAEMDVYSFGMVMWEFWHDTVPFDGDLRVCQKYVGEEESRPMILEDKCGGEDMAKVIRLCWQTRPEDRPKMHEVCLLIAQMIHNRQ